MLPCAPRHEAVLGLPPACTRARVTFGRCQEVPGSWQVPAVAAGTRITWRWLCPALPPCCCCCCHPHGPRWAPGSAASSCRPGSLFSAGPSAALKTSSFRSLLPGDVFPGWMNKLIAFSPQSKQLCECPGSAQPRLLVARSCPCSTEDDSSSTCLNHAPGEIRSPQRKPHAHSL